MAQVTVLPARDDLPRDGAARAVAGLTACVTLLTLNRMLSQPNIGAGSDLKKVKIAQAFNYSITGQTLRYNTLGDVYSFTGLTPVPPGSFQRYFLLVDRDENVKVQEAVSSPFANQVLLTNLSGNRYAATVKLLNSDNGWAVAGGCAIQVDPASLTPFVPGVDDIKRVVDGGKLLIREFIDGFDGTILLPAVGGDGGAQNLLV